ncbi:hemophore-related protein [Nocardia sp. NPDC127579]|uniref:hemophore-related protein n=1 Tax=Nocardia sp. NPDC127579 TaxID=3345402 RepID=UPI0036388075
MIRFPARPTIALLAGGAGAIAVLLAPGVANAGPMELAAPLLNSDCSFAQVDAALHAKAPALANILDNNPEQKAELKAKFDLPVEQRRAEFQRILDENPDAAAQAQNDPRAAGLANTIAEVAAVCHTY